MCSCMSDTRLLVYTIVLTPRSSPSCSHAEEAKHSSCHRVFVARETCFHLYTEWWSGFVYRDSCKRIESSSLIKDKLQVRMSRYGAVNNVASRRGRYPCRNWYQFIDLEKMNCLVGICEGTLCSMRLRVTRMLEPEFDPVSRDQESGGLTTGVWTNDPRELRGNVYISGHAATRRLISWVSGTHARLADNPAKCKGKVGLHVCDVTLTGSRKCKRIEGPRAWMQTPTIHDEAVRCYTTLTVQLTIGVTVDGWIKINLKQNGARPPWVMITDKLGSDRVH